MSLKPSLLEQIKALKEKQQQQQREKEQPAAAAAAPAAALPRRTRAAAAAAAATAEVVDLAAERDEYPRDTKPVGRSHVWTPATAEFLQRTRLTSPQNETYLYQSLTVPLSVYDEVCGFVASLPDDAVVCEVNGFVLTRATLDRLTTKHTRTNTSRLWMNDEIVNAGLAIAESRARDAGRRTISVTTFFSEKMRTTTKARTYLRMHEWGDTDYVLVPVNIPDCHFYLLVLDLARNVAWDWNTMAGCSETTQIVSWLRTETQKPWSSIHVAVESQRDMHNCGVFTVAFANTAGVGATPRFGATDTSELRKAVLVDILAFDGLELDQKRPSKQSCS